jgi:hypothetical protein
VCCSQYPSIVPVWRYCFPHISHVLLKVPNPNFSVLFCVVSTPTQFQILLILVALERCENISKRESKANENSGVPTFARKVSERRIFCCVVYR